ncbi:MAG: hypothetical protein AAF517_08910, partial [Planctomycetota bacterium]
MNSERPNRNRSSLRSARLGTILGVVVSTVFLVSLHGGEGDEVDLRPEFRAGKSLRYALEQRSVVGDGKNRQASSLRMVHRLETKKVAGGEAHADVYYDTAAMILVQGERTVFFDSQLPDDPKSNPYLGRLLRGVVGKKLGVRFSVDGSVKRLSGVEAIRKHLADSPVSGLVDEASIRTSLEQVVQPSPGR